MGDTETVPLTDPVLPTRELSAFVAHELSGWV